MQLILINGIIFKSYEKYDIILSFSARSWSHSRKIVVIRIVPPRTQQETAKMFVLQQTQGASLNVMVIKNA